jgi:dihydrofolate reductase
VGGPVLGHPGAALAQLAEPGVETGAQHADEGRHDEESPDGDEQHDEEERAAALIPRVDATDRRSGHRCVRGTTAVVRAMTIVRCNMSVSVDGFISGPEHLDEGFDRVQDWAHRVFAWREREGVDGGAKDPDSELFETLYANVGGYVMGRTMFDQGEEPWGEDPPFHAPVFVVTHRPREVLTRDGGTSFTFVTNGIEEAVARARDAAGDQDVHVSGGGTVVSQALAAGLIDELHLHVAPVLLGKGMALFEGVAGTVELEVADVIPSPHATHVRYLVK